MRPQPLRRSALAAACIALLTISACGSDDDASTATTSAATVATEAPAGSTPATTATAGDTGVFPVTIENCGETDTFDKAPTAAITMNQHVTEILLALGLEGSMVGTAYIDSTIRPDLLAAYDTVPVLAAEYPNREQVLAAEPDIVIGGFASAFGDDAAGARDLLREQGIGTYLTEGYCPDFTGRNTFDQVRDDITNLGSIFGVSDKAAALLDTMQAPVDQATAAIDGVDPVTVFVYDSGTEKAFTAAGNEMTTALIELAGGKNVFDDVDDTFTEVSWEDVVARDPDVILILNYGSDTVEDKEAFLESDPIASTLRAVQNKAFVAVDLTDVVPGIRNGDTVLALAKAFHPDAF